MGGQEMRTVAGQRTKLFKEMEAARTKDERNLAFFKELKRRFPFIETNFNYGEIKTEMDFLYSYHPVNNEYWEAADELGILYARMGSEDDSNEDEVEKTY